LADLLPISSSWFIKILLITGRPPPKKVLGINNKNKERINLKGKLKEKI
jgi:hypothetical protein